MEFLKILAFGFMVAITSPFAFADDKLEINTPEQDENIESNLDKKIETKICDYKETSVNDDLSPKAHLLKNDRLM